MNAGKVPNTKAEILPFAVSEVEQCEFEGFEGVRFVVTTMLGKREVHAFLSERGGIERDLSGAIFDRHLLAGLVRLFPPGAELPVGAIYDAVDQALVA